MTVIGHKAFLLFLKTESETKLRDFVLLIRCLLYRASPIRIAKEKWERFLSNRLRFARALSEAKRIGVDKDTMLKIKGMLPW